MPCLSKANFSKPFALKRERLPLPSVGPDSYVVLQELTGKALLELQARYASSGSTGDLAFVLDLLALAVCDDEGVRLFDNADDVREHLTFGLETLRAIGEAAARVSGMVGDEKKS